MFTFRKSDFFRKIAVVTVAALLTIAGASTLAGARFHVPDEDPWAPIYARFLYPDETPQWVVLYLYRERSCVPDDFNLLAFFDLTFAAWDCPMLLTGTVVYDNADDFANFMAPRHASLRNVHGVGVPVLFVPIADWMDATQDGVLTLNEAEAIPNALQGVADFHKEVLHPTATPAGGGAQVPKFNYRGRGTLNDGRSFSWHASGQIQDGIEHLGVFSVVIG